MRHLDLGRLEGPVLIFGGPYSNAQALKALIGQARHRGIAPAQMICTGDVVAYGGAPMACVEMIRDLGCAVLAGNCERQLASGAADCGCGFDSGSACDLLSARWYAHAAQSLDGAARAWMGDLPDLISFTHAGARYGVIHGGVQDVARFLWPVSPEAGFAEEWQALEAEIGPVDHVIAGHAGIGFVRDLPRGRWINAGVIGMPPHDGRPETEFALLKEGNLQLHRLRYDVAGAMADMAAADLPEGYRMGLQSGYWPSEDVLPPDLRRSAGDSCASG